MALKFLRIGITMEIPVSGGGGDPEVVPVRIMRGREELKELFSSILSSLCEANLIDEAHAFHDRVIAPSLKDHRRMLDYDQIGEHIFVCKFQPMVELLLFEMKNAATAQGWTDKMRKDRIAEALTMAGF